MNLERHIDRALEHYKTAYSKLDAWQRAKQEAREAYNKMVTRLTREAAEEENAKLVKEYTDRLQEILAELNTGVAEVEAEYMEEVENFYAISGMRIDAGDQALLASGIMTVDEIAAMVVRYGENPTMLRIIGNHVTANHVELPTNAVRAIMRAASAGENEKRIFTKFKDLVNTPVRMAQQDLAGTEAFMNTMLKADEYAKEIKVELTMSKLVWSDRDLEMLSAANKERMEEQNKGFPGGMDYNW